MASSNCQFHYISYDRFGIFGNWITTTYVVTHNDINSIHPQFLYLNLFFLDRLPFETRTPFRYLIAVFVQYTLVMNVVVIFKCLTTFGFGTCSMLFPLSNDMKNNLKAINNNAKPKRNRWKIANQFSQFVRFHSQLIQFSWMHMSKFSSSWKFSLQ